MFAYCGNNPVDRTDPSGCSYASTQRHRISSEYTFAQDVCIGLGVGGDAIGLALGSLLSEVIDETAALVRAAVATLEATNQKRTQHVYVLTDPDADNIVKYVGRTNDPHRRMIEHQHDLKHPERARYQMQVVASGLTLQEARTFEQVLISAFTLGHLENARREIAEGKVYAYRKYLGAATEIVNGATEDGLFALIGG